MREIVSDDGAKVIKSPWFRAKDAADYCRISRSTFEAHCKELPHGGTARTKVWHVDILNKWIRGKLEVKFPK